MEFCGAGSVSDLMKIRNKTVSGECCVDVHVFLQQQQQILLKIGK